MPHATLEARAAYQRAWNKRNPDKTLAKGNRWRAKNRDKVRAAAKRRYAKNGTAKHRLRTYSVTQAMFDDKFARQDFKCALMDCRRETPLGKNWSLDHDHVSGNFRGVLCIPCNTALGFYEKNKRREQSFRKYLDTTTDAG